jgi:hypothetical protein
MKIKKILKKIENNIIKKKVKNFNFFTLEYCSNTKLFFKKTKNIINSFNENTLKHPLYFRGFNIFTDLKLYLNIKKSRVVLIVINKVYIKKQSIKDLYVDSDQNLIVLFTALKRLFVLWCFR